MSRVDRLLRLTQALRRLPAPATAADLAAETGVSLRTLYRDIATLRAGGALIDGAPGLGYTLVEDPALPPQMFTRIEVEALALGLAEVAEVGDPDLTRAARDALAKVVATLPDRVARQAIHATTLVHRRDKRPPAPPSITLLRQAAWDERAVDIRYSDRTGAETDRRILPLCTVVLDKTLMCLAFCTLRQDFRQFHLSAILSATLTDESFRPRRVPLLRSYLAQLAGG